MSGGKEKRHHKKINKNLNLKAIQKPSIPKIELKGTNGFNFYSVYPWLNATKTKKYHFTNLCHDANEFSQKVFEVISELVPILYGNNRDIFPKRGTNKEYKHCHPVEPNHLAEVKFLAEKITGSDFSSEDAQEFDWWQVGFTQSIRVFGVYDSDENSFYPLFCDWHHLVYEDKKHNQLDTDTYAYSPKQ